MVLAKKMYIFWVAGNRNIEHAARCGVMYSVSLHGLHVSRMLRAGRGELF